MAENLHVVVIAIVAFFGVFTLGLAYAQWQTRNIPVYRKNPPTP
ncbi:hypothetical protein [Devosia sp. FKR38]|nr:hypothetical protein [Devosia sp. FKR38]